MSDCPPLFPALDSGPWLLDNLQYARRMDAGTSGGDRGSIFKGVRKRRTSSSNHLACSTRCCAGARQIEEGKLTPKRYRVLIPDAIASRGVSPDRRADPPVSSSWRRLSRTYRLQPMNEHGRDLGRGQLGQHLRRPGT